MFLVKLSCRTSRTSSPQIPSPWPSGKPSADRSESTRQSTASPTVAILKGGGYVYFCREREAGWYKWERDCLRPLTYTKLETGEVAMTIMEDGAERIGALPDNWEELMEFDEDWNVIIGNGYTKQHRGTWNED